LLQQNSNPLDGPYSSKWWDCSTRRLSSLPRGPSNPSRSNSVRALFLRASSDHRERDGFDVHLAAATTLLGKERPEGEVTVFPTEAQGNVFGTIGAPWFEDRVLVVDPAGPSVGVTDRCCEFPGDGWVRLSLIGESGLPVTGDVQLAGASDRHFLTLLSTGEPSSVVTSTLHPGQNESRHKIALGGASVEVTLQTGRLPEYVVPLEGDLQLVLGADVLSRFLTVFDFPGRCIWMWGYPGAI
jgi:hypothetical protein